MNNVTAIIVSYNTYDLLKNCYESIRKFYPCLKCVIVDGSDSNNMCNAYAKSRSQKINKTISVGRNVGHGNGMKLGIAEVRTDYFLLIDSDVTIDKAGVIEAMLERFLVYTYGVGQVIKVNKEGLNDENGFNYLHPHFALIGTKEYFAFDPIINHGAPMLKAMISGAHELVDDFKVSDFITHHERGTRKLNPKTFNPKFWDKI